MHRRKCKISAKISAKRTTMAEHTHTHGKDFFLLVELRNVTKRRRYLTTKVKHTVQCLHVCINNNILFKRFFILYLHTCCVLYMYCICRSGHPRGSIFTNFLAAGALHGQNYVKRIFLTCNKGVSYLFFTFK
jgi:hypothetical protein